MAETAIYDASLYLERNFEAKGIGGWRSLYLSFIEDLAPYAVIELGAKLRETADFEQRLSALEARTSREKKL